MYLLSEESQDRKIIVFICIHLSTDLQLFYITIHKILYDVIAYHSSVDKHGHKVDDLFKTLCQHVKSQFVRHTEITTMGLPQQPVQPADDTAASNSAAPTQAGDLPPAALELAGKLFDFARQGKTEELAQYISA